MVISLVLGCLAIALLAYFLHLFFQLNRSETKLQEALRDIEASMLLRYGRPQAFKPAEDDDEEAEEKPRSASINKKA